MPSTREVLLHVEVVFVGLLEFRVCLSAEETALRNACRRRDFFVVEGVAAAVAAAHRDRLNRKVVTHFHFP